MKRTLSILLVSVLLPLIEGCAVYNSVADFFSQRYVNVVAYFNTYYNAKGAFDDGEREVLQAQQASWRTATSAPSLAPPSARQKFNIAIEKSSKILSFYPTSKWVDGALMIIGKSYYYLGDDIKADRKFLELIAKFPGSSRFFEAELWHGKSLYRQKKTTEAEAALTELYSTAMKAGEKAIAGEAEIAIGQSYYGRQDYAPALPHLQRGLALSDDEVLNTQVALQIGFAHDKLGQYQKAAAAFRRVADFSPDYASLFEAKLQEARMLVKNGSYAEGLAAMEAMLEEAKNAEYFGRIRLEIANTYLAQGRVHDATDMYVVVDTTYSKSEEGASAAYALAQMAELGDRDYARAKLYYDRAKTAPASSTVGPLAVARSDVLMKYFVLRGDIAKYDSLISEARMRLARKDSTVSPDSSKALAEADTSARKPASPFAQMTRVPSPAESLDSLQTALARSEFELAGIFYLQLDRPDSASLWYTSVIDSFPRSDVAPRALYILADLRQKQENPDSAHVDSLYGLLVARYPESPYAAEARKRLNLPPVAISVDPVSALYDSAESLIEGKRPSTAIPLLNLIAARYPESPFAPQALYALGWLYENTLDQSDSASAVYRRLAAKYPASVYANSVRPALAAEDEAKREAEAAKRAEEEKAAQEQKEKTAVPGGSSKPPGADSLQTPTRARKPG